MSRFLAIADEIKSRIEGISVADGYNLNIGDAVYVNGLQPIPVVGDSHELLAGSVVIDPGEIVTPDEDGTTRSGTVVLDTLLDRTITIIVAWPIDDKDNWLQIAENIGEDLRSALYRMPASVSDTSVTHWSELGVRRIGQVSQSATRPRKGSRVLHIETQFRLRYSEN